METTYTQSRFEIQARWRPMVEASGLDSPAHTPENTYRLSGAIIHDPVVASMRMRPEFQLPDPEYPAAFSTNWTKLFESMGPNGRAALKGRIQKAHGV